jgi:hypothetical protein
MVLKLSSRAGLRLAALCLATLPLSDCVWLGLDHDTGGCPVVQITGQLGSVTRFNGDPGNPANLAYRATLSNVSSDCSFDDDSVTVSVNVMVLAEIGPAAPSRSAEFPYFAAITGPNDRVLDKKQFGGALTFEPTQHRAGAADTLTQRIPLKNLKESGHYHVLLGFQLSPDELKYNRSKGKVDLE